MKTKNLSPLVNREQGNISLYNLMDELEVGDVFTWGVGLKWYMKLNKNNVAYISDNLGQESQEDRLINTDTFVGLIIDIRTFVVAKRIRLVILT